MTIKDSSDLGYIIRIKNNVIQHPLCAKAKPLKSFQWHNNLSCGIALHLNAFDPTRDGTHKAHYLE